MVDDFSQDLIKEYKHWGVYVFRNQGYLGRCVVWCKREDAFDLADTAPEEQMELFLVLRDLREAAKKLFQPDWFNYSFLGNDTQHLHGHFIPRYAKPITFMNVMFEDKLYGHNYKTDHSFITTPELLSAVQDKLKAALR
jgi:diadenosine tetraphosphate (Ap4A) HIT family hydrolase